MSQLLLQTYVTPVHESKEQYDCDAMYMDTHRTTIDREVSKLRHNSRTKLHIQVCHAVHKLTGCKAASCRQLCLQRSLHHYQQPSRCAIHTVTYALSFKIKLFKIQIRASLDFYPCCLFQRLVFSELREIVATD